MGALEDQFKSENFRGNKPTYCEKRGLNRQQAANYIGISPSMFDELIKEGVLPQPVRLKSRVLWDIRRLDEAFDEIEGHEENPWDSLQ
jgi:predicted DNA-binding transcriptional regulator AlpA